MRAWVDYFSGGVKTSFELTPAPAVFGRQRDCAVVLGSEAVSRKHARIERVGSRYSIRDLHSRNGTAVNGRVINEPVFLVDGDAITICDCELSFRTAAEVRSDLNVTMIEGGPSDNEIMSTMDVSSDLGEACRIDPSAALQAVLAVTRELAEGVDLDEVLPRVLEKVFDVYPNADHGVILLRDASGDLVPAAVKSRGGDPSELQISRTVVERAMSRKEAILSANAAIDTQFEPSQSLLEMPIRSLMCVPLLGREDEPLGVIELHSEARSARFTKSCLDLLVSVGSAASIAVENARLHARALRQDRLERDLEHAKDVQRSFLPSGLPQIPGYAFFVEYAAARTVGGDYYGFAELPGDKLAIGIGDVSGKGLPAALMMARLASEVRFAIMQEQDPAAALARVDRSFAEDGLDDHFVTFVLMLLDRRSHRLSVANAGHQPPLLRLPDGRVEAIDVERVGVPLNVSAGPDSSPVTSTIDLPPGATVLAYTDGLSEAANPAGDMFGEQRIREVLARGDGDPVACGERLVAEATAFAAGRRQRDDTTLVCFGRAAR